MPDSEQGYQANSTQQMMSGMQVPYHTHNGIDSPFLGTQGGGVMRTSVYDPANIGQQLVGTTATQTLTNKTLTNPVINEISASSSTVIELNAGFYSPYTTDTDGATITFDLSKSNVHTVTLGGNRTLALSNPAVGQCFIINLVQDGTGSRTVTWFSTIKWAGGSAPTLTTTNGKADSLGFTCVSSGNYYGFVVGQNI